jgi:hypothetical protein
LNHPGISTKHQKLQKVNSRFADQAKATAVKGWTDQYIDYRTLKKAVKRIPDHESLKVKNKLKKC